MPKTIEIRFQLENEQRGFRFGFAAQPSISLGMVLEELDSGKLYEVTDLNPLRIMETPKDPVYPISRVRTRVTELGVWLPRKL